MSYAIAQHLQLHHTPTDLRVFFCATGAQSRHTCYLCMSMMMIDRQLEDAIHVLLAQDSAKTSITPAHIARHVGGNRWRNLEVSARKAALRVTETGDYELVIPSSADITAKTPIRIRRSAI